MPQTKQPFYRLEIIHGLIRARRYGKRKMLERLNDILETQGHSTISSRTLNNDLNELERLGARIIRPTAQESYYQYAESFYLSGVELDEEKILAIEQAIQILQRSGITSVSDELRRILQENRDAKLLHNQHPIPAYISFEDHNRAQGSQHLIALTDAILLHIVLEIHYKPFLKEPETLRFHPYYLKEHRNRWFVLGWHNEKNTLYTLALDRIEKIKPMIWDNYVYQLPTERFDPNNYFENLIGVTHFKDATPEKIIINVARETAPYIRTKELHKSMVIIEEYPDGSLDAQIEVEVNYELISLLLSYGEGLTVMQPNRLRAEIIKKLELSLAKYQDNR